MGVFCGLFFWFWFPCMILVVWVLGFDFWFLGFSVLRVRFGCLVILVVVVADLDSGFVDL